MHPEHPWQKVILRIVTSPAFEALAVVAVVGLALSAMVDTEALARAPHLPVLFGYR